MHLYTHLFKITQKYVIIMFTLNFIVYTLHLWQPFLVGGGGDGRREYGRFSVVSHYRGNEGTGNGNSDNVGLCTYVYVCIKLPPPL